jgi:hypothetical protein
MHTDELTANPSQPTVRRRKDAPVFVLGCVRSGTTLLYHMLLSSGDFAIYRTESHALNLLEPRFGDLSRKRNRERLMDAWKESKLYKVSGLDAVQIRSKVMAECRNGGDFLRIVMEEIARQQGVRRWAECTPEHVLYLDRIKETIPEALIVHIIRDGRDVALSADRQHYVRRLPWDKKATVMVSGLYWNWMVNIGRRHGRTLGDDYMEVHFEDLVTKPQDTLARLGAFIDHDLNYERILQVGIGSVSEPNTSFKDGNGFNPLGRWETGYTPEKLAFMEGLIGDTLEDCGYKLESQQDLRNRPEVRRMRSIYRHYFDTKLYLKAKTPLGQLLTTRDLSWL